MKTTLLRGGFALAALALSSSFVEAQTQRALERRADRNTRQTARQTTRADYYGADNWNDLNPWLQRSGVAPVARAANAVAATADAVGDVTRATTNAADRAVVRPGEARYGYREGVRDADRFFYDYYSYTPTYYYGQRDADRYAGAVRYFDSDNDGVYDYQSNYRDSDNDGAYDQYDRVDFYRGSQTQAESVPAESDEYALSDSRRYQVEGEIEVTKSAQVNGNDHLLIGLKQEGDTLAIDLGPVDALRNQQVAVGQSIAASGPVEVIGEKRILIADYATINGRELAISRGAGPMISGSIVDVTTTRVGSSEHYLAVVETQDQRQLVDFGPVKGFKSELRPSTQVELQGVPVMANEHRVIMADQVRLGGETIRVDRSPLSF